MTDCRTWQTLVELAKEQVERAQHRHGLARKEWARTQDRLERTEVLLASARKPDALSSSQDFIQFRAYQQKLQQLRARLEREVFVLDEDMKAEGRKLEAARETLRRYEAVLARASEGERLRLAKAEQRAMDQTALSRYLVAMRKGQLAGGIQ